MRQDAPGVRFWLHTASSIRRQGDQVGLFHNGFDLHFRGTLRAMNSRSERRKRDMRMSKFLRFAGSMIVLLFASACEYGVESSKTIVLPDGNAEHGQALFVNLQCTACHTIRGLDLPQSEVERPFEFALGGSVTRVKSYAELVTSVINPSHTLARGFRGDNSYQDGKSPMTIYNDVMTVTELVDLVAFLQTRYEKVRRPGYRYVPYPSTE